MHRVNLIYQHPKFKKNLALNQACEKSREFCGHDLVHFLDVARLALIISMKERIEIEEALIYAAALLHDIGRHRQYEEGIPHELAGWQIAGEVLRDCMFTEAETDTILEAILSHRNVKIREERSLRGVLYRADKLSRNCFACAVQEECNWGGSKKNMEIVQ